jgi:hypothetical protein
MYGWPSCAVRCIIGREAGGRETETEGDRRVRGQFMAPTWKRALESESEVWCGVAWRG